MKRRSVVLLFALATLVGSLHAQEVQPADAPLTLESLNISLWPEYDRAGVLVIYRGSLTSETLLPRLVEIGIPATAGQPTAVAFLDESGRPFNQPYTTRLDCDWLVIAFQLESPNFQIEYYAPLPTQAGQRTFAYALTADYPIEALTLEVQEPPTAEDFRLDPPADSVTRGSDGLTYYTVQVGPMAQHEKRSWTLTYFKPDAELTKPSQPSATSVAPSTPTQEGRDSSMTLVFLVAFVALVGVGATAFWLGRRTQAAPGGSQRMAKGTTRRPAGGAHVTNEEGARYCHHCGARLRGDGEYCQKCGTRVRGS